MRGPCNYSSLIAALVPQVPQASSTNTLDDWTNNWMYKVFCFRMARTITTKNPRLKSLTRYMINLIVICGITINNLDTRWFSISFGSSLLPCRHSLLARVGLIIILLSRQVFDKRRTIHGWGRSGALVAGWPSPTASDFLDLSTQQHSLRISSYWSRRRRQPLQLQVRNFRGNPQHSWTLFQAGDGWQRRFNAH